MSLVGPRPEPPALVEELSGLVPYYERRALVKPGLTGWAQVRCGYAGSHFGTAWKMCHDLYYIKHRSAALRPADPAPDPARARRARPGGAAPGRGLHPRRGRRARRALASADRRPAGDMRVDVSVLTPVLNEEEHIREAARDDARPALRRHDRVHLHRRRAPRTAPSRSCESSRQRDPRVRVLDNPRRSTPMALNIGLAAARGEFVARMDAHTHYPHGLPGPRRRAPAARRRRARERPAARPRRGHLVAPRGAGARHARSARGGAQFRHASDGRDRGRQRLHRRLAALDARGARRLGRGLAQQPGLRAGRAHPRRRRAHRLPAGDGRRSTCRATACGARAPVLALRPLPRQDLGAPPGEHAPLAPARPRAGARAGGRGARRSGALAPARPRGRRRSGAPSSSASRPPRRGEATPPSSTPRRRRCRPAGRVRRDAPRLGARLPVGCVRFGPPLRALAHVARRSAA